MRAVTPHSACLISPWDGDGAGGSVDCGNRNDQVFIPWIIVFALILFQVGSDGYRSGRTDGSEGGMERLEF